MNISRAGGSKLTLMTLKMLCQELEWLLFMLTDPYFGADPCKKKWP